MALYKKDIPDIYNDIPFPEGYFDKPMPGNRLSEDSGYDLFMALDYAELENKELHRLSAAELDMFKTSSTGEMLYPRKFAEYLEKQYETSEENKEKIIEYSIKYADVLKLSEGYRRLIGK